MTGTVLLFGASGSIGSAVSLALDAAGCSVIGVSRSTDPSVDVTSDASVRRLFASLGPIDAVVSCVGSTPFKTLDEITVEDCEAAWVGKALAQIRLVRLGLDYVRPGASFTLTSGVLSEIPVRAGSLAAMANGAIEAFVRSSAAELGNGIRVNAVSPGVLLESPGYHAFFPGLIPVPASKVAQAYRRSVDGIETGKVFRVFE